MSKKAVNATIISVIVLLLVVATGLTLRSYFSKEARSRRIQKKLAAGELAGSDAEAANQELEELQDQIISEEQTGGRWRAASFPLKRWMKGNEIKVLQAYINQTCRSSIGTIKCGGKALYPLKPDGYFGECTESALIRCRGDREITSSKYAALRPFGEKALA